MTVTNVNHAYLSVFKETHYPSKEELHRTYGGEITAYELMDMSIYLMQRQILLDPGVLIVPAIGI